VGKIDAPTISVLLGLMANRVHPRSSLNHHVTGDWSLKHDVPARVIALEPPKSFLRDLDCNDHGAT
jgi:hypothetical protein